MTMQATDSSWVSDVEVIQSLTSADRRPPLLIQCKDEHRDAMMGSLMTWCAAPLHVCRLPDSLTFPSSGKGTILLSDVSALSLSQQIELNEWIDRYRGDVQIVSMTPEPLWPLVEQGRFLESLFYRLNVVFLEP